MSANNSQHISPRPPQKRLLGDIKINNFDFLRFFIIEYILWFNIPMT